MPKTVPLHVPALRWRGRLASLGKILSSARAGSPRRVARRHRDARQGPGRRAPRRRLKILAQPQLLIIDEIGYIPIEPAGGESLLSAGLRRYERGAIILTSNQSLGAWGEVFGDPVIASAILDRLLHHSITVNIRGDSYRLKEKMKAGLLKAKTAATAAPSNQRRDFHVITGGHVT